MRNTTIIFLMAAAPTLSAHASTLFPAFSEEKDFRVGIGIGALVEDEGYRDIGTEGDLVPIPYLQTERLRILGPQLTYRLLGDKSNNIGLRLDYRFDGYEASDGDVFRGMDERKSSLALGFSGQYRTVIGNLDYSIAKATSASKGLYGNVQLFWPIKTGNWIVTPRAGLEFFDKKYTNYYFGVNPNEVRSDRRQYTPGKALNLDVGVDLQRDLSANHTLLGSIKYRHYASAIKDSPLIEKSGSPRFNIAYLYRF